MKYLSQATALLLSVFCFSPSLASSSTDTALDYRNHLIPVAQSLGLNAIAFDVPCEKCFVGTDDRIRFSVDFGNEDKEWLKEVSINGVHQSLSWDADSLASDETSTLNVSAPLLSGLGNRNVVLERSIHRYRSRDDVRPGGGYDILYLMSVKILQLENEVLQEPSGFALSFKVRKVSPQPWSGKKISFLCITSKAIETDAMGEIDAKTINFFAEDSYNDFKLIIEHKEDGSHFSFDEALRPEVQSHLSSAVEQDESQFNFPESSEDAEPPFCFDCVEQPAEEPIFNPLNDAASGDEPGFNFPSDAPVSDSPSGEPALDLPEVNHPSNRKLVPEKEHHEQDISELRRLTIEIRKAQKLISEKRRQMRVLTKQDFVPFNLAVNGCDSIGCILRTAIDKLPNFKQFIQGVRSRWSQGSGSQAPLSVYEYERPSHQNETREIWQDFEESGASAHDELDFPASSMPPYLPPPSSEEHDHPHPPPPPPPPFHDLPHGPPHLPFDHHGSWHHAHFFMPGVSLVVIISLLTILFRRIRSRGRANKIESSIHLPIPVTTPTTTPSPSTLQKLFSRYRQPRSTADYDEKRTLILQQEGLLEQHQQAEISQLRLAQHIALEMVEAEEGRARLHYLYNSMPGSFPGPSHSSSQYPGQTAWEPATTHGHSRGYYSTPLHRQQTNQSTTSLSFPPPPQYEAELEGDMMVVDGFMYTPPSGSSGSSGSSNEAESPSASGSEDESEESSVVDCSPRMSCETTGTRWTRNSATRTRTNSEASSRSSGTVRHEVE